MTGRFAPSPTGDLHLGNLRTALVAWLAARSEGSAFLVRMEDLDRVTSSREHERTQLEDLASLGLHHDGPVVRQSERFHHYEAAIAELAQADLTYPCYCTRREIREAAAAPHGAPLRYPGTCRDLTVGERSARERAGRRPALRLRGAGQQVRVRDLLVGEVDAEIDDVVLRRNDGVPAYHVAVVVDDAFQGVTQVVRGDDLLPVTPTQVFLQRLLRLRTPRYLHVPLVLGPDGERLAKRHGAVTLRSLAERGVSAADVFVRLAVSLGLADPGESVVARDLIDRFDRRKLSRAPWVVEAAEAAGVVEGRVCRSPGPETGAHAD